MTVRVHHLQHVPFEGLGSMAAWLQDRGHRMTSSHLYRGEPLPALDEIDWLIVMGGPMGVADEGRYPWLAAEKRWVRAAIEAGKPVLGICLGAQLIASALGAAVGKSAHREIGWHPVTRTEQAQGTMLGEVLPRSLEVFHWHGDRFEIPAGAVLAAASEACPHQAFSVGDRVVGLQFHLETTPESARALIEHGRDELDRSRYVQSEREMLADESRFLRINRVMSELLDALEARAC